MTTQAEVFTFDEVAHKYYLDGIEIPGTTGVLKASGLCPTYNGHGEYAERGQHVHRHAELYDLNDPQWLTINPEWEGYIDAWIEFRKNFVPELIEWQSFHPALRYAGTLDRTGHLDGSLALLDIKTGAEEGWHRYQTAGYWLLLGRKEARRGCVYLTNDGKFSLKWHDDSGDLRVFMAAITIYNAKRGMK